MGKRLFILILGIALIKPVTGQDMFVPPLNIPLFLSSNFGELRADHFHSGIDIKTQGVTGKKVVAVADGYVYLILVSPGGFGKAIYLRHPSGYSTVYAHLDSFSPEVNDYIKRQQYQNKSYAVTLYPPKEQFVFRQGDLIGFSGNTGSSSGPHLHFEVRKSDSEKPVNPLKFNFGIEDNLKPVIDRLAVYPASASTLINGSNGKLFIRTAGSNGNYSLQDNTVIEISGTAGFGISCRDLMNNTSNRFGINYLELFIDSIPWFSCDLNEFSFAETRYINAHIDYEALIMNNVWIHRTFVLPGDKLSMYRNYMNNGYFDFTEGETHKIKITVTDGSGNSASLNFTVRSKPPVKPYKKLPVQPDETFVLMPFGKSNYFKSEGINMVIPKEALYDTLYFKYSQKKGNGNLFSPVHKVHDRLTPVHKAYTLSLKPDSIPPQGPSKLLIVRLDDKNSMISAGGTWNNGFITADVTLFGDYAVAADTIPPVIIPDGLSQDADMSLFKEIRIKITDNLSGIKSYTGLIDGKWALFEYDAKNDLLFYRFDDERITKGIKHTLKLTVTDNRNNLSVLQRDFFW